MKLVVTGTDTGVGKTIFAAALVEALGGHYWKPIQAGLDGESDSEVVRRLAGLPDHRLLPEAYRLQAACSPHLAARREGVTIEPGLLGLPEADPLVVEGAGGVLVPIRDDLLMADLFAMWGVPVVLVARTALGTINHSLLSISALRARAVPICGIAFVGPPEAEVEATIAELGKVKRLGRLAALDRLDRATLAAAFHSSFRLGDFG